MDGQIDLYPNNIFFIFISDDDERSSSESLEISDFAYAGTVDVHRGELKSKYQYGIKCLKKC